MADGTRLIRIALFRNGGNKREKRNEINAPDAAYNRRSLLVAAILFWSVFWPSQLHVGFVVDSSRRPYKWRKSGRIPGAETGIACGLVRHFPPARPLPIKLRPSASSWSFSFCRHSIFRFLFFFFLFFVLFLSGKMRAPAQFDHPSLLFVAVPDLI